MDEFLAGLPAERLVEVQEQRRVRTGGGDRPQLLRQRIDQRRHSLGRHNGIRVPVECDNDRKRLVQFGVSHGLPNNLLVPEVHAVEKADGQANLLRSRFQFRWTVYNAHQPNLV